MVATYKVIIHNQDAAINWEHKLMLTTLLKVGRMSCILGHLQT